MSTLLRVVAVLSLVSLSVPGCGSDDDDGSPNEAVRHGLGASCAKDADCQEAGQSCLMQFKGGYCGVPDCKGGDCPAGSGCVAHTDGKNYCFLVCLEKIDCNYARSVDVESNCSASITPAGNDAVKKACVPPSGS
jgi:hypothetical protein